MTWDTTPKVPGNISQNPESDPTRINVKDAPYGAVGDGVTNDYNAIAAAIAAGNKLLFPEGTYYLGDTNTTLYPGGVMLSADGGAAQNDGDGAIDWLCVGNVKFVVNTTQQTVMTVIRFINASSVYFGPQVEFLDTGYLPYPVTWQGVCAINLYADSGSGPLTNVTLPSIKATDLVQAVCISGGTQETTRVSNVKVGLLECDNVFYGFNCQNQGDHVSVDILRTRDAVRSYFVYGVTGHRANVYSYSPAGSSGDVNITSYYYGLDTSDIHVKYVGRELNSSSELCTLNTVGSGTDRDCTITNVSLDVDIDDSLFVGSTPFRWNDYLNASLSATLNTGSTDNVLTDFRLTGSIDPTNFYYHFYFVHQPTTKCRFYPGSGIWDYHFAENVRSYCDIERGGARMVIDGWYYDNVAASFGADMPRLGSAAFATSWIAPRPGRIVSCSAKVNAARVSGLINFTPYINGVSTTLTTPIDGTNTTFNTVYAPTVPSFDSSLRFAAGDEILIHISTAGWGPTTADARACIEVML